MVSFFAQSHLEKFRGRCHRAKADKNSAAFPDTQGVKKHRNGRSMVLPGNRNPRVSLCEAITPNTHRNKPVFYTKVQRAFLYLAWHTLVCVTSMCMQLCDPLSLAADVPFVIDTPLTSVAIWTTNILWGTAHRITGGRTFAFIGIHPGQTIHALCGIVYGEKACYCALPIKEVPSNGNVIPQAKEVPHNRLLFFPSQAGTVSSIARTIVPSNS